jgi:hypothetical protein
MKEIWKYELPESRDIFDINVPIGSEILCVQVQDYEPKLWILVNPLQRQQEVFRFHVVGTRVSFDNNFYNKYIGTFQDREFVWHLFQVI